MLDETFTSRKTSHETMYRRTIDRVPLEGHTYVAIETDSLQGFDIRFVSKEFL